MNQIIKNYLKESNQILIINPCFPWKKIKIYRQNNKYNVSLISQNIDGIDEDCIESYTVLFTENIVDKLDWLGSENQLKLIKK